MRKLSSKEILSITLQEMMCSKPFDEITVNAILKDSGISRATFYKYFYSKEALLCSTFDAIFDEEMSGLPEHFVSCSDIAARLLQLCVRHAAFLSRGMEVADFSAHVSQVLYRKLHGVIALEAADQRHFLARMLTAMYMQEMESLLQRPQEKRALQMAAYLKQATKGILREFMSEERCGAVQIPERKEA